MKIAKEWGLIAICFLVMIGNLISPEIMGRVYPVLDFQGGNQFNMEVQKPVYHCGEMVIAKFRFQKQRDLAGTIKWKLISSDPTKHIDVYLPRIAASPVMIHDHWADVEKLPAICSPGKYHFEGTLSYPLFVGNLSYGLRTECFEVKDREDK